MKILFVGDIVGKGGRKAVQALVPELRREFGISFCIANAENMAGGGGMTRKCVEQMLRAEVDVLTGGGHIWDQRGFDDEIGLYPNVLRPANLNPGQPGRGWGVFKAPNGVSVAVISVLGRVFMNGFADCPFMAVDRFLQEIEGQAQVVIVDMHAEATSEKHAMGWYLDGRASAVLGTHTHVPTADQRILPQGTAVQCDVGMVGSRNSVLGRDVSAVVRRFSTGMPTRFKVVEDDIRLHGAIVTVDEAGRAVDIQAVSRDYHETP